MRFKLDENFDLRLVPLLAQGGHDVDTVRAERLSGSPDETTLCVERPNDEARIPARSAPEGRDISAQGKRSGVSRAATPWVLGRRRTVALKGRNNRTAWASVVRIVLVAPLQGFVGLATFRPRAALGGCASALALG